MLTPSSSTTTVPLITRFRRKIRRFRLPSVLVLVLVLIFIFIVFLAIFVVPGVLVFSPSLRFQLNILGQDNGKGNGQKQEDGFSRLWYGEEEERLIFDDADDLELGFTSGVGMGLGTGAALEHAEHSADQGQDQGQARPNWCSQKEYNAGTWKKRVRLFSGLSEIRTAFSLPSNGRMGCEPIGWDRAGKGEPPLDMPEHLERIMNNSAWVYEPGRPQAQRTSAREEEGKDGALCEMNSLTLKGLIKRLLRSRGGLVLVGDSLTEQQAWIFQSIFLSYPGLFRIHGKGSRPRFENIYMNAEHSDTSILLKDAGVSVSRLRRPLFSFYLERHLIHRGEMDEVFAGIDGYIPLNAVPEVETDWVRDTIWWESYQRLMDEDDENEGGPMELDQGVKEESTVLVLNSGPHWVDTEFVDKGGRIPVEGMLLAWDRFRDIIYSKTTRYTKDQHTVFWRSIAPAHPHCEFSYEPEKRTSFRSKIDENFRRFNWELFPLFNDAFQQVTSYTTRSSSSSSLIPPSSLQYLDIWSMSLQRPDSHLLPPTDCLHFCYQGVIEEWNRLLWHLVVSQSKNGGDYEGEEGEAVYS